MSKPTENGTKDGTEDRKRKLDVDIDELMRKLENLGRKASSMAGAGKCNHVTTMEQVRTKMVTHADEMLCRHLRSVDALEHLFYISGDGNKKTPKAIFIASKLNGVIYTGTRFDFTDIDIGWSLAAENFVGVALEIVMDDLEDDGFELLE